MKQAVPRFTQEFPKIKVQVENVTGTGSLLLATALMANAAAGTLQDTFHNENDVFITLARQNQLKDIAPALKSLRVNQNDIVDISSTYSYQGKQYGLPLQLGVIVLVINKTMFRDRGVPLPDKTTTYPQWVDMMRKVSRPEEGVFGYLAGGVANNWNQWMPVVWANGGDRWSADLKRCLYDQPAVIEGLQFHTDLMWRHQVAPPLNAQGTPIPPGISFVNGSVACATAGSPGAAMDQQVGGKFEWDVMYMPVNPTTKKRAVPTNANAVCVSANADKHGVFDQAVQLVAWMASSKTAQDLIVEIGPTTPVSKPVLSGSKFLAGPPVSQKILVDMLPDWRDPQTFLGWNDFRDQTGMALTPAFANQTSVPDAAKAATRVGQLVLDKIPS